MNVLKKVIVIVCFAFNNGAFGGLRSIEELSVYYKKEIIGGTIFVHREDVANGIKKTVWSIDGEPVEYDRYEEELLEAEKEVRKIERRAQLDRRKQLQEVRLQASHALHKKVLQLEIAQIEAVLKKIDDHRLASFLLFDQDSVFTREEFEKIGQELLIEAKKKLYSDHQEGDLEEIKKIITQLDLLPQRLEDLFSQTVNNAIKQCDDTKLLKDLLAIL